MASEVKSIASESLEAAYRALTPSQSGFTQDLQASNTIIPILDLTNSAGTGTVPTYLQTALAFGSQTSFDFAATTTVLANTAGFWRFYGVISVTSNSGGGQNATFDISDGLSSKQLYKLNANAVSGGLENLIFDFTVFLRSGDSVSATSDNAALKISGSYRQVADVNGVLVNPSGFTPQ
jgi:hypothetical protein